MDISKEKLQESLKVITGKMHRNKETLEKCATSQRDLDKVKNIALIEITRLQGEERAIKALLLTFEPPTGDKK